MHIKRAAGSVALALVATTLVVDPSAVAGRPTARDTSVARTGVTDVIGRRPSATKQSCTRNICVHYSTTGKHAPDLRDHNHNKVPDFVDTVRSVVDSVHVDYKHAGYTPPLSDHGAGGDDRTDIYLRDVGARGSRCLTDDPRRPLRARTWAFCILDNNFSHREFPTGTPTANLKVTAAHEYFHAIQLAYDSHEDGWLRESTATWAADELFPSSTRTRQYLADSPMSSPLTPLDTYGGELHGFPAGTAIFWRYLSEHYPTAEGGMPTLVRNVWRRLDARTAASDAYSLQALDQVLGERGTNLTTQLALFADANRHPSDPGQYEDGSHYDATAPYVTRTLSAASPGPTGGAKALDHLSSFSVRFVPHTTLTASSWRLNLAFDLPDLVTRPVAMVTPFRQDGTPVESRRITLDASGNGVAPPLKFDVTTYKYVEVTLVNASDRTEQCGSDDTLPLFSCSGKPVDDNLTASVTGTLSQLAPPPRR